MDASGGATAGGAYLLRAKERYNARVTEGAKAYKKSSDIAALFAEKDGALDDLEAAGFLLANAFRIGSRPKTRTRSSKCRSSKHLKRTRTRVLPY